MQERQNTDKHPCTCTCKDFFDLPGDCGQSGLTL